MKLRFAFAFLVSAISNQSFAADLPIVPPPTPPPVAPPVGTAPQPPAAPVLACSLGDRIAWASNTQSFVYYCEGDYRFRDTVNGSLICEWDAIARGLRPASGACRQKGNPPPPCNGPWRLGQKDEAQACCPLERLAWMTSSSGG